MKDKNLMPRKILNPKNMKNVEIPYVFLRTK
jgi:hypothetical protein